MQITSLSFLNRWINFETEVQTDQQFFSRRRDILFSRILILSAFITTFLLLKDFVVMKVAGSVFIDFIILLIILCSLWMVQSGLQKFAKTFFLILMNAIITFYASALPSDRGIFLYFFPLITMAFAIFDDHEFYFRIIFIVTPIILLLLLVLTDFNLIGGFKLATSAHGKYNLIINAVITSLTITFFVEFMMKANRKSEKLLRLMAEDVQEKKEDLEKINRELDRFVYSTSHDLRAPLLSIKGLIKLALADSDTSHDKEYFAMIGDRTNKLDDFIHEIIDYSRNARTELVNEPTNVTELVDGAIANLQFLENASRITFETNDESGTIMLDKSRLKIIINNLVSNAIKYQNLQAEKNWVKITTAIHEKSCVIKIEDNGIGIQPDLQGRIFEMFFRATEKSTGSGLGLYIVKEIVDRMKGTIEVQSRVGKSTEFVITLPVSLS